MKSIEERKSISSDLPSIKRSSPDYAVFLRAEWAAVSGITCIGLAFIAVVAYLLASGERHKAVDDAKEEIEELGTELNVLMSAATSTTRALAALVFANLRDLSDIPNHNGTLAERMKRIPDDKFTRFAQEEHARNPSFWSIQTRPSGVITQVFPLGSAPIGLDLTKSQPGEYANSRKATSIFISGPRQLAQGFPGFVTYLNVYLNSTSGDGPDEQWWGSVGVVLNLTRYLEDLHLERSGHKFYLTITNKANLLGLCSIARFPSCGSSFPRRRRSHRRTPWLRISSVLSCCASWRGVSRTTAAFA